MIRSFDNLYTELFQGNISALQYKVDSISNSFMLSITTLFILH